MRYWQREYDIARNEFGMDEAALGEITRTALEAAFVGAETRNRLLERLSGETEMHKSVTQHM